MKLSGKIEKKEIPIQPQFTWEQMRRNPGVYRCLNANPDARFVSFNGGSIIQFYNLVSVRQENEIDRSWFDKTEKFIFVRTDEKMILEIQGTLE